MEDDTNETPVISNKPQQQNRFVTTILIIIIAIFTFGAGIFSGIMISNSSQTYVPSQQGNGEQQGTLPGYGLLNEVINIAKTNYLRPLTEEDLAKSVLLGLDPYSIYFNKGAPL